MKKKKQTWYQYDFEDVFGKEWKTSPRLATAQLSFEDIYDKSVLGELSDDDLIRRKYESLKRCRICCKTIISGSYVESQIYPVWDHIHEGTRCKSKKESSEAQKNLNNKYAQQAVIRLLNTNFGKDDLLMTLTYKDGYYPDYERAKKDIESFIKALRRERKKLELEPLKYLYVIEYVPEEEETKKVRIHHHIVINKMDRDIAESKWRKGRVESKYAEPDEDFGLEGYARYITKTNIKGHRRWSCSKNLKKPDVHISTTKLSKKRMYEMVKSGDGICSMFEKLYKDKFDYKDSQIYYSDYVGGFYIYGKLKVREGVIIVSDKESSLVYSGSTSKSKLPKSRVFVDIDWRGTFGNCEACYSIVFEGRAGGTAKTIERYGRINNTTRNRAILIITDEIMQRFVTAADIELHVPSSVLSAGINFKRFWQQRSKNYEGVKNAELIDRLLNSIEAFNHNIKVISESANEYSEAEKIQRNRLYDTMDIREDNIIEHA